MYPEHLHLSAEISKPLHAKTYAVLPLGLAYIMIVDSVNSWLRPSPQNKEVIELEWFERGHDVPFKAHKIRMVRCVLCAWRLFSYNQKNFSHLQF